MPHFKSLPCAATNVNLQLVNNYGTIQVVTLFLCARRGKYEILPDRVNG